MSITGKRLKIRREELDYSLRDLAKKTGISTATLSRYENNGLDNATLDKLIILADTLDTTIDYLSNREPKKIESLHEFYSSVETLEEINPKSNLGRFFQSKEVFFKTLDDIDRKEKYIKRTKEKLFSLNSIGTKIVDEYLNYIYSKEKYVDKNIINFYKMMDNFFMDKCKNCKKYDTCESDDKYIYKNTDN